jgi:hypothetical protein
MQQYPGRFEANLRKCYPEVFDGLTLHMFSGAKEWGVTTDIREETGADIIGPFHSIPVDDGQFDCVIADPPYANHWANEWHEELPKPKHILKEAARLTRNQGLILILHIIVIPAYKEFSVKRVGLHPILCGPNNAVRVLNVFRKNVNLFPELSK